MRGRLLNCPAIGRAVGFALVAAAIDRGRARCDLRHDGATRPGRIASRRCLADPLDATNSRVVRRSRMAAKDDAACEAAWAENRRRFFTYRASAERRRATPSRRSEVSDR